MKRPGNIGRPTNYIGLADLFPLLLPIVDLIHRLVELALQCHLSIYRNANMACSCNFPIYMTHVKIKKYSPPMSTPFPKSHMSLSYVKPIFHCNAKPLALRFLDGPNALPPMQTLKFVLHLT